jgi:hypothetical protein
MDRNLAPGGQSLGDEILNCYVLAMREQKAKVAEQLLCALEELALTDSACRDLLDQAYLRIGKSSHFTT